jgi:hypothetical protein
MQSPNISRAVAAPIADDPSRRRFLAAGSVVTVFASLRGAIARAEGDKARAGAAFKGDPVFAAIERHRASTAAFRPIARKCADDYAKHGFIDKADSSEWDRRGDEEGAAYEALLATPPRTAAGLRASIAYALENERILESIDYFLELWLASDALNHLGSDQA